MRLPNHKFGRVITSNVLDKLKRPRTPNLNFSHVTDVKKAGRRARRHVLGYNARIFDRHIPAAKIHHFGLEAAVNAVQRGLAKLGSGWRRHSKFSRTAKQNRN
jgi:hypothetical protein